MEKDRQVHRAREGASKKETLKRKKGEKDMEENREKEEMTEKVGMKRRRMRGGRVGGGEERGASLAFHSHPSLTGESFVLSRRNTHKSSMKHPRKLKPVRSCQTAPSAPASQQVRMRTSGPPFLRPSCGVDLLWAGREEAEMKGKGWAEK